MRLRSLLAVAACIMTLGVAASSPAQAFDRYRCEPDVWVRYGPYSATDPFAYRPCPRAYYPYYNSGDWRPAWEMRRRAPHYVLPGYYQAWGYPDRHYRHRKLRRRHAWHEHR